MLDYLENLRRKPEPERKKAIFRISFSVTLAVLAVWGAYISLRVSRTDFAFDASKVGYEAPDLRSAFSDFIDGLSAAYESRAKAEADAAAAKALAESMPEETPSSPSDEALATTTLDSLEGEGL
ncbi:MAG: hypothetical protein HZA81_01430 [Candidatus Taylorbacteria bacterium]|nr:hypothetical protein [Candidatus Taylorbacteria bacterium]